MTVYAKVSDYDKPTSSDKIIKHIDNIIIVLAPLRPAVFRQNQLYGNNCFANKENITNNNPNALHKRRSI